MPFTAQELENTANAIIQHHYHDLPPLSPLQKVLWRVRRLAERFPFRIIRVDIYNEKYEKN